jgi:1-deoxy-D-xylulose-5-phosphate synthase
VLPLGLPDRFLEHGSREQLLAEAGLDAASIEAAVRARFPTLVPSQSLRSAI